MGGREVQSTLIASPMAFLDPARGDIVLGPAEGQAHCRTLIFLHSCFGCAKELFSSGVGLSLVRRAGFNPQEFRIISLEAPMRVGAPEDPEKPHNSWFNYATAHSAISGCEDRVDGEQLRESRATILGLLGEELRRLPPSPKEGAERGEEAGRLVVVGISQGASLAVDLLLHAPEEVLADPRFVGVLACRGMLQSQSLEGAAYRTPWGTDRHRPRLMTTNGGLDCYLAPDVVQASYRRMAQETAFGVDDCIFFPLMGHHGRHAAETEQHVRWLRSLFPKAIL